MKNKASLHTTRGVWIQNDTETVEEFFNRATAEDDVLMDKVEEVLEQDSWVEMERKSSLGDYYV
jgi:phage gp29-like protein